MKDFVGLFFSLLSVRKFELLLELDHRQFREMRSDDAHACKNVNLRPVESSPFARSIENSHEYVGPYHHDHAAKPKHVTYREFEITDQPPKRKPGMPVLEFFDEPKYHSISAKELRLET